MMYAQQVSGPQLSHLSSQGVTLDDFQSTFWLRCSVSMNQLPKLVSFVWVIETMATELSSLTPAFLEGLCHPPPGPCPRLGSQGTSQKDGVIAVPQSGTPLPTLPGERE